MIPILMALLLGLRHATDPDHLAAVSSLLLNENRHGHQRAARLGLAWGLGHATTLSAFGLPIILYSRYLTDPVQRAAEVSIGIVILILAGRLLIRWRRGHFHLHPHRHGSLQHVHFHAHDHSTDRANHPLHHTHSHAELLGRSPVASFGIGLVHGVGGSAGASVLLMGTVAGKAEGVIALLVFAGATGISMSVLSVGFAHALGRPSIRRRLSELIPVLGAAGIIFGVWYSLGALQS